MLKPCRIKTIREFLTGEGLELGATDGINECWEGMGYSVLVCVCESHLPAISIKVLLEELGKSEDHFNSVISVLPR